VLAAGAVAFLSKPVGEKSLSIAWRPRWSVEAVELDTWSSKCSSWRASRHCLTPRPGRTRDR